MPKETHLTAAQQRLSTNWEKLCVTSCVQISTLKSASAVEQMDAVGLIGIQSGQLPFSKQMSGE